MQVYYVPPIPVYAYILIHSNRDFGLKCFQLLLGKSVGFKSIEKCSLVKRVFHLMNSLHQTEFLNAPKSKWILPTTVGNNSVQKPYSNV